VFSAAQVVIEQKTADAVLVLWPGAQEAWERQDPGRITVFL